MAEQNPDVHLSQQFVDAIATAERLLMLDENVDEHNNHQHVLEDFFTDVDFQEPAAGNGGAENFTGSPQIPAFGNSVRIPIWPVPPSPHSCTCCQTLREFQHTNGTQMLKLEVHGRLGLISHAVLESYNSDYMSSENREYHMFDFCQESISSVKQFLIRYCDDRKREGYVMLQDPLAHFYNALCIGLGGNDSPHAEFHPPQTSRGNRHVNQDYDFNQSEGDGKGVTNKSYFASQRERTCSMTLGDLAGYFHLPIKAASREMNMCPSALKSICRKEGLLRWPYRKIKSIEGEISKKKGRLNSSDANERAHAGVEIQELERRLARIYEKNVG